MGRTALSDRNFFSTKKARATSSAVDTHQSSLYSSLSIQQTIDGAIIKLSMQKLQLTLVWVLFSKGSLCTMFKTLNYYSLSFDKSLNRVTQSAEIDFMVRYLNHSDYLVKTRYVKSSWLMLYIMRYILYQTFCPLLKG